MGVAGLSCSMGTEIRNNGRAVREGGWKVQGPPSLPSFSECTQMCFGGRGLDDRTTCRFRAGEPIWKSPLRAEDGSSLTSALFLSDVVGEWLSSRVDEIPHACQAAGHCLHNKGRARVDVHRQAWEEL